VKRLGDKPIVIEFASDGAKIEVAAKADDGTPGARASENCSGLTRIPASPWRSGDIREL
jgi:hypothetical protein